MMNFIHKKKHFLNHGEKNKQQSPYSKCQNVDAGTTLNY